LKNFQETLA